MHRLLERQIKKYFGTLENIPDEVKAFLEEVNISYEEADQERTVLQQTLEEIEKNRRAQPHPPSPGYRFQGNTIESTDKPTIEMQQAWAKGKTVVRRSGQEEINGGTRIAIPIKLREETLGALNLSFENDEDAMQTTPLLEELSARLALAMDNARLFAETQTALSRTNALLQVSRAAIAFESVPDLLNSLVNSVAETLPADRVTLFIFDFENRQIENSCAGGAGVEKVHLTISFKELLDGLSGWVIQEQKPALSLKGTLDPRESPEVQRRRQETNCGSIIVVPLLSRNKVIGTITAINTPEQPDFTERDVELMMAMANQGATAIENAHLFQSQQRRATELQAAAEVSQAASSILELDQLLEQSVEVIRERFGLYYVGIFLVDTLGDWAELRAGTGEAGRIQIERHHKLRVGGESMIGQCISTAAARISQDVGDESVRFKNPVLPETRSEMALPLLSRGQTIGAMTIQSTLPAAFSQENITTLQTMADQLANAIQNAQLFTQTEARASELAILNEMARSLTEILDVNSIVEQVYQFTSRLLDAENFYLALFYPEQNEIEFKLYTIEGKRVTIQEQRRKAGKGLTEHVIRTRRPLLIEENVDEYIQNITGIEALGRSAQCWLGVPMLVGNQVLGVLNVQSYTTPFYYTRQDQQLLFAVASQTAIAIQNGRLFEQTQKQNQEMGLLNEMGSILNTILDRKTILEQVYTFTSRLLDFSSFVIAFYHPDQDELSFPFAVEKGKHLKPERISGHGGLLDYVIRTKTPLLLSENVKARTEELGIKLRMIRTNGEAIESWLGVPILAGNTIMGVLSIQSTTDQTLYSERHRDILTSIANLAANALENARLFEQTELQNQELAVLNEMGQVLNALLDKEKIIENILVFSSQLIEHTSFLFAFYNSENDEITFPLAVENGERLTIAPTQGTRGLLGHVIQTKMPLLVSENLAEKIEELGIQSQTVGDPAKSWLAVPILTGESVVGVISVQTVITPRLYTERHRDLLISIANQAATALQNADLFEQAQKQNEELAVLNEMSQVLTTLLDETSILEQVYGYTNRLIGTSDFFAALYDEANESVSFPFIIDEGTRIEIPARKLKKSLVDYVIRQKTSLLLKEVNADAIHQLGVEQIIIGKSPHSWLGVPMSIGDQVMGVIGVQSVAIPRVFSERDRDLLTAIAGQTAIVLQNSHSFRLAEQRAQEAQQRSEELAVVNRVVSSVSEAFDLLEGLNIIAQALGEATGAGRVGVALLNNEETELQVVAEFRLDAENPSAIGFNIPVEGNPSTQRVLETKKSLYIEDAQNDPILAPVHDVFQERGILSLVILPLLARGKVVGTLGLDILEKGQVFTPDQLRLAESVVLQASNAIHNAQLFEQTQQALSETAILYQASGELNSIQTYHDILAILQKYTILGQEHIHAISVNLFDHPWTSEYTPETFLPLVQWNRMTGTVSTRVRNPLSDWPKAAELLRADAITFIEDVETDPRLNDDAARSVYARTMHAKSILFAPLVVAREWIGHIIAIYDQCFSFSQQDNRRLTSLSQQATVALQNLRLLAESRQRASQLLTASEIARSASETLAQDQLLYRAVNLIRDRFNFYHASVFLLDDSREWAIVQESTGEAGAEMKRRGHRLEVGSQSIVGTVTFTGNPLIINDVSKDGVHKLNPLLPDTKAELGIPLKLGRRVIGALDVQSTEVDAFTPDDVAVLQILADQIAIAIDNSRSYAIAQEAVKEANNRLEEISTLFEISQSLASAPLLTEQIAEIIASRILRVVGGRSTCGISIYDPEEDIMRVLVDISNENGKHHLSENPRSWDFNLSDFPASKKVMDTLQPLVIQADDPNGDPSELAYLAQVGCETLLIMPLAAKGVAFGLIEIENWEQKRYYSPDQLNLALTVANQGAAAMDNARLYEEQIRTAEQLREVDKLKNQFLANMSHELRTPLNSIIGFSRVILKGIDGPITDLQEQDLSAIYNSGSHLLGLINDILDISRIEAGKMELGFEDIDVANLITSVLSTAKGLLKDKPVRLDSYIEANLPHAKADPTRLRQIILNLLQNATKFTDEGSITVRAVRQVNASGKLDIMISVADTGMGIAPEDQYKLFQPFSQVDASPTRKAGGTGLGLSITRNLIELHGGRIDLISDVGKGSTFFFTIPAIAPTGALATTLGSDLPQKDDAKKIVLAIEDDEQIIHLYKRYLEPEGYQVIPLTDSSLAVQQAQTINPFAITLDVHMPNQDGWQVIKALKSNQATRNIPVIFCTIVENQAKGYSLGAADYLMKPILGEDLIQALTRLESINEIKHILVIDDDPDDLRLVEKALQLTGTYQIRLAQGGRKGLEAMRHHKPDAVILDLSMPDVDGFSVLETMRAEKQLKDIPVIILTALDLDAEQQKMLSEYTQEQLRKGFLDADGLLACLQQTFRTTQTHTP